MQSCPMICLSLTSSETNQPSKTWSIVIQNFYILSGRLKNTFADSNGTRYNLLLTIIVFTLSNPWFLG